MFYFDFEPQYTLMSKIVLTSRNMVPLQAWSFPSKPVSGNISIWKRRVKGKIPTAPSNTRSCQLVFAPALHDADQEGQVSHISQSKTLCHQVFPLLAWIRQIQSKCSTEFFQPQRKTAQHLQEDGLADSKYSQSREKNVFSHLWFLDFIEL